MHSRITLLLQSQPFSLGLCLADFLGIFFSDGQFLLLEGTVFLQIVTHGFRLFPVHVRLRFFPGFSIGGTGFFKFILLLPGKAVISGGKAGFLVLTLPVGFLPVYLFFPGVIVIFDLRQFLFGTGLHAVYLFLPVFSL